jgi:hypothetical protein
MTAGNKRDWPMSKDEWEEFLKDTKCLTGIDFMMMDVHRELDEENVHPETLVDKSARSQNNEERIDQGVGVPHKKIRLLDPLPENVELLDVSTSHRLQIQRVLQSALNHELDEVMVIGWHDDGEVFFLASDPSIGNAVYRLRCAEMKLLNAVQDRWNVDIPITRDMPDDPA